MVYELHRFGRYVDPRPAAFEKLRGDAGCRAAAEGIEHQVACVAGGLDNAFEQGERLLGWIADALLGVSTNGPDIGPYILQGNTGHFIEISLVGRNRSGSRLHNAARGNEFGHSLFAVPPISCHAHDFVLRIAFCRPAGSCQIAKAISPAGFRLDMAIELIDIVWIIRCMDKVPCPTIRLCIEENCIVYAAVLSPTLSCVAMRARSLPNDLASERIGAKNCVHDGFQIVARGRVAMEIDASGFL